MTVVNSHQMLQSKHLLSLSGGDTWPSHGVSFSSRFWPGLSECSQVFSKNTLDDSIGEYTELRVGVMPFSAFLVMPWPPQTGNGVHRHHIKVVVIIQQLTAGLSSTGWGRNMVLQEK